MSRIVKRAEIDSLIKADIKRSIGRCNSLIKTRLKDDTGLQQQVEWVILLGDASRYPLIKEELDKDLEFCVKLGELDRDNLKTAVAKGAVLALAATQGGAAARIEFDWQLSERLPFTIGYMSRKGGAPNKLYEENSPYKDLKDQQIKFVPPEEQDKTDLGRWIVPPKPNQIALLRRWPGEEYEPYLAFHFPSEIDGSIKISFDHQRKDFRAFDDSNKEGELIELWPREVYRSPVQSGDL